MEQPCPIAQAASGTQQENTEEDQRGEKRKRGKKLKWDDTYHLIQLVAKHKKKWKFILEKLHDEHRLTDEKDPLKLRDHFNAMNNKRSSLHKPFKEKPFKAKGRGISKAERERQRQQHCLAQELRRKEHEHTQQLLRQIADNEKILSSEDRDDDEIGRRLLEAGEERKAQREARLASVERMAKKEEEAKDVWIQAIKEMNEAEWAFLEMFAAAFELPPPKRPRVAASVEE